MTDSRTHVVGVHHVSFRVDDLDEALVFYETVLGCEQLPRPDGLTGNRGAWLQTGQTQVHLTEASGNEFTGTPPTKIIPYACHVAFHTDDLDRLEAGLRDRGLVYERGTAGVPQIFVQDPTGNLIEFTPF